MVWFHSFPEGNASSFRAYILSKMIVTLGHKIDVVTPEYVRSNQNIDGINVINIKDFNENYVDCVKKILIKNRYDFVIRSASNKFYLKLNRLFKKYKLPILLDSVEWFDASNWKFSYLDPRYYYFHFLWYFIFPKAKGIIAISRMIEHYYVKKTKSVVRIPTVTDISEIPFRVTINDTSMIHFVFIGMLDKGKDNLNLFVRAMEEIDPKGEKLRLDIYGPENKEVIAHLYSGLNTVPKSSNIFIHGRVSQTIARKACLEADYNVFFRYNRKSANAGFPTKLGEAMTMGTPTICNDTGDIALVMKNGINGFLLKKYDKEEVIKILKIILSMSLKDRENMRINARRTSEEFFDYHNYLSQMKSIIERIL